MASTYLSRTIGSTGNRKICTTSLWFKRANIDTSPNKVLYSAGAGYLVSDYEWVGFSGNQLYILGANSSAVPYYVLATTQVFRDVNAWYHLVYAIDTTQATASDRVKIWINGERVTAFSSETYPSLNFDTQYNLSSNPTKIGDSGNNQYFDGSMTHFNFIDGTAYDASTFGETDATTGIWKPITEPSVTYGTNGFFLKFENSANMDLDSSPNNLTFSTSGTLTQTVDTPSNVFTTWNPLENYYQSATLSNGNTTIQTGNSQYSPSSSTLGVSSGKWYWEVEYDALSGGSDVAYVGVLSQFATNSTTSLGTNANDYGYYVNGNYYNNNTGTAYGTTYTTGDIIGVALDLDNNKLYFSKNGTWQNSGDPESGATGTGAISITNPTSTTNGAYFPSICDGSSSANATFKTNFGNGLFGTTDVSSATSDESGLGIFEYTVPSGYYALCTKNINEQEYD
jgi:hypothetical protein